MPSTILDVLLRCIYEVVAYLTSPSSLYGSGSMTNILKRSATKASFVADLSQLKGVTKTNFGPGIEPLNLCVEV